MKEENGKQMSRRGFLKMGATASVAMGLSMAMPPAVADTLGISTKQGLAGRGGESMPFS